MIIESMIAGIVVVFVSSLFFASAQAKRQREWDLEDSRPTPIPDPPSEPEPEPTIDPFVELRIGTPCPKCLIPAREAVMAEDYYGEMQEIEPARGPQLPRACFNNSCRAKKHPHLHTTCYTCGLSWFMAPADAPKKKDVSFALSELLKDAQ